MRLLILIICLQSTCLLAAPRVVTSITPLQEITATLMSGVGTPQAIITDGASAHHFAFRPSHMRLLQRADLVIWIDRHFEAGFGRVAQTLPRSTTQLELLPALGVDDHDGHIWFSSQRLQQVVAIISARLVEIDPENAAQYRRNAQQLSTDIAAWREAMRAQLQQRPPRFITDHRFSGHFSADMDYPLAATIHDHHDDHGGLGELAKLESGLRAEPVNCLLTLEPEPPPLALELAQKYQLRVISLAAVADSNNPSAAILQRLQRFAAALDQCA